MNREQEKAMFAKGRLPPAPDKVYNDIMINTGRALHSQTIPKEDEHKFQRVLQNSYVDQKGRMFAISDRL